MNEIRRRSSLANEIECADFMERTGQTIECIFNHALVTSEDFAVSLLHKGKCVCGAAI